MFLNKKIGVVVPAYNEEKLIKKTLSTMPDFVDLIFAVNDGSKDQTKAIIEECHLKDARVILVNHPVNLGLGRSLIDGYNAALENGCDVIAVMAGDGQMAPDELPDMVRPLCEGRADYSKGNRLLHPAVAERMPTYRLVGNAGLTFLTKMATGYWHVMDPQCGYTAITSEALKKIKIDEMAKRYAYNADILNRLNIHNFRVIDVPIEPIYGEEQSKIILRKYIPLIIKLLTRLTIKRLMIKYLVQDFSAMILFYLAALVNLFFIFILSLRFIVVYFFNDTFPMTTSMLIYFSMSMTALFLSLGIWMDIEDNKKLKPNT